VSSGPQDPGRQARGEPEPNEEALRRLEERLDRASQVAERLIVEAAARVVQPPEGGGAQPGGGGAQPGGAGERAPASEGGPATPPPAGWQRREDQTAGSGDPTASSARGELDVLLQILNAVRDRLPPELQHRLGEALREVLLAVRALIDWYLERTERRRSQAVQVEDIPIL
jgi:hypothetical protein